MRLSPTPIILALALAAAASALPCAAAEISLDIAPAALVKGPQVTLGDIAVVHCDDGAAAEIQGIVIGSAPMPGKTRRMDATYIKVRLRQHGFDPEAMQVEWPEAVLLTTRSMVIPGTDLVEAGKEALLSQAPPDDGEITATCSRVPADLVLAEGALELKAEVLGAALGASRLVKLTALVDGRPCSSQTICYRLQRLADVLVAHSQVDRGEAVKAQDVAVERREVAFSLNDRPYDAADNVVGLLARRALRPGDIVMRSAVERPPAIERGDKVWVTAVCGGIRICAEVVACEDAAAGARVRLKNLSSDETFVAQVDADGHAFVTP